MSRLSTRFFLRYTLFIPAYPVGMGAEMVLVYKALPYIESRQLYSFFMPNALNMSFSYLRFCQVRGLEVLT